MLWQLPSQVGRKSTTPIAVVKSNLESLLDISPLVGTFPQGSVSEITKLMNYKCIRHANFRECWLITHVRRTLFNISTLITHPAALSSTFHLVREVLNSVFVPSMYNWCHETHLDRRPVMDDRSAPRTPLHRDGNGCGSPGLRGYSVKCGIHKMYRQRTTAIVSNLYFSNCTYTLWIKVSPRRRQRDQSKV